MTLYEQELAKASSFAQDPHFRTKLYSQYLTNLRDGVTKLSWNEYRNLKKPPATKWQSKKETYGPQR